MEHFAYPSIEQFRSVVKTVRDTCKYKNIPLPTLTFTGTVKLHGTNAAVVYDYDNEMYAQSRTRVLSLENDNMGFALFVEQNKKEVKSIFAELIGWCNTFPERIVIYGEWCGQGIMKGVAISQLPRMFVIFGAKAFYSNDKTEWIDPKNIDCGFAAHIANIFEFQTWQIDIDFNNPELIQNKLVEITNEVEAECPVGKALDVSGTGEGVVWSCHEDGWNLLFKVKGEKHSESKVKTLAEVDLEKVASNKQFVDTVCTNNRMEACIEKFKEQGLELDIKNTGAYLKIVMQDILKEESDLLVESGIEWKSVTGLLSNKIRNYWMTEALRVE